MLADSHPDAAQNTIILDNLNNYKLFQIISYVKEAKFVTLRLFHVLILDVG